MPQYRNRYNIKRILLRKGMNQKQVRTLVIKMLTTIIKIPKFEEVLFDSIIMGDTEEEVISYAELIGVSNPKNLGKKWFKDFYGGEHSHIYWGFIDFWGKGKEKPHEHHKRAQIQELLRNCVVEMKQRKLEIEEQKKKIKPNEQVKQETRIFTYLLHNPKAMTDLSAMQIAKITNADEGIVKQIINGDISPATSKSQEKLMDINYEIISKGKDKVLKSIDSIDAEKFQDLKALSDILDTAFKQNRLLEGKSTENTMVGVADIYDSIILGADRQKKEID